MFSPGYIKHSVEMCKQVFFFNYYKENSKVTAFSGLDISVLSFKFINFVFQIFLCFDPENTAVITPDILHSIYIRLVVLQPQHFGLFF